MDIKDATRVIEQMRLEKEIYKKKKIFFFRLFIAFLILSIISLALFIVFISLAMNRINFNVFMPLTVVFMVIFLISMITTFTSFMFYKYVYSVKEKYREEILKVIDSNDKNKNDNLIKEK